MTCTRERTKEAFYFTSERVDAELVEIHAEAPFRTLVPLAVVTPEANDAIGHSANLILLHPSIKGNGIRIHL